MGETGQIGQTDPNEKVEVEPITCPECLGAGYVPCVTCDGEGYVDSVESEVEGD